MFLKKYFNRTLLRIFEILSGLLLKIPLLGPFFSFSYSSHKRAFGKGFFIWLISTVPIFASLSFHPVPEGEITKIGDSFFSSLNSAFSVSEIFLYVAAYLSAPLLLGVFRYFEQEGEGARRRGVFRGYGLVWIAALLLLIATAMAYSHAKSGEAGFSITYFYVFVSGNGLYFYFLAIYLWYLTLLDNEGPARSNYGDIKSLGEKRAVDGLEGRIE